MRRHDVNGGHCTAPGGGRLSYFGSGASATCPRRWKKWPAGCARGLRTRIGADQSRRIHQKETGLDYAGADELFEQAFKEYGLDVIALSPGKAAEGIQTSAIRTHLVTALDEWTLVRNRLHGEAGAPLFAVAALADDDPWWQRLRGAARRGDRVTLEGLAKGAGALSQPRANLALLAAVLADHGSGAAAERLLRQAQHEHPVDFWINFHLAYILSRKSPPDSAQAARFYQAELALRPQSPVGFNNLGNALKHQGKLPEAEAAYRKAIALKPDLALGPLQPRQRLADQGEVGGGRGGLPQAIALEPDDAEAHCMLGLALQQQGRFADALAALKQGHELGSRKPGWPYPSAQWVRAAAQLVVLDNKLPKFLSGEAQPADASEGIALAKLCQLHKKRYRAAARFYAGAFASQPALADDLRTGNRYNVACAAALAGCGQGKDADQSDPKERARLRQQALAWLRVDLTAWRRLLDKGPEKARPGIVQQLRHWRQDADLSGVRDQGPLARLSAAERLAWQQRIASRRVAPSSPMRRAIASGRWPSLPGTGS